MPISKLIEIATRFVDLVLSYKNWGDVRVLRTAEEQVLFETVSAAGFNPGKVIWGKLAGNYRDQDGSSTGQTYPINELCRFKIVDQENKDDYFATGWLDCAVRRVVYGSTRQGENREKLIEAIAMEIERSIPLAPIQLTPNGDMLRERQPDRHALAGLGYLVDHTRDNSQLSYSSIGIHKYCENWMDRMRATEKCDAIVCRGCHLRVLFPEETKTYGELRQALGSS